jgi:hypothetical protein
MSVVARVVAPGIPQRITRPEGDPTMAGHCESGGAPASSHIMTGMKSCCRTGEPTQPHPGHTETLALYRRLPVETQNVACAWFCQAGRPAGLLPFLAVGSCLRERRFEIAAVPFADHAPLWRVGRRGAAPEFFVDVVAIELSQEELLEFRVSSRLVETLQSIPVNQRLHMTVTDYRRIVDPKTRERIVGKTREWLVANAPSVGDRLSFDGVSLTMMPRDKVRDHLAVIGPAFSYWIRKLQIDDVLLEQVRQHLDTAAEHPYVLAVVAPERVGLSRRCYSELLNDRPDEPQAARRAADDGHRLPLFEMHPEISAAAWVWKSSRRLWEMKAIHNAGARHSLPDELLDPSM